MNAAQRGQGQEHHLAEINISWLIKPLEDPANDDFRALLAPVNEVADSSEGFVWRLMTSYGDATGIEVLSDPLILVNVSVWVSLEALRSYLRQDAHVQVMRRRDKWFRKSPKPHLALWWVKRGHEPTTAEALERLEHLWRHGETEHAFSFKKLFAPPAV